MACLSGGRLEENKLLGKSRRVEHSEGCGLMLMLCDVIECRCGRFWAWGMKTLERGWLVELDMSLICLFAFEGACGRFHGVLLVDGMNEDSLVA